MTKIRNQYWQTGFFLLVVIVAVLAVRHYGDKEQNDLARSQRLQTAAIIKSQLAACQGRGAILRAQVNYDTDLIRTFMLEAVNALKKKPDRASQIRAASYQRIANGLLDVSQPDCDAIYKIN